MSKLLEYIKKCRRAGFGDEAIKNYLLSYNAPSHLVDEAFKKLDFFKRIKIGGAFTLLILMIGVFAFNPQFIGFVTQGDTVYSDNVNLDLAESGSVLWTPSQSGELTSLLATGKVIGNGTVKMYIRINDTRYLVIDTSTLQVKTSASLITGMVIDDEITTQTNETTEEELIIEEEPVSNESEELVVEENITQIVEETIIAETNETIIEVNESVIDAINETLDLETNETIVEDKNESISLEINSSIIINETILSENNSTEIINETIVEEINETVEVNETVIPETNETIIEVNETVVEVNETVINESVLLFKDFENVCEETCVLPSLSGSNYTLEFEIEGDARIIVDILKYTVTEIIVVEENITTNISVNESLTNFTITESNATINSSVEVEKPVKWLMKVDKTKTREVILPKETFNITVSDGDVIVSVNDTELNITNYNLEKEKDILEKELKKLEKKQLKEKKKNQKTIYDEKIIETNARITELTLITTDLVIDENITLTFTNETIENNETNNSIVVIEYYTEGPDVVEEEKTEYNKLVTISSDLHYENIKAYTDIIETQKELINLYWHSESGKIKVLDINYVDTNNNNLIDRIEWIVPHLSNETYEVNISVLNVQSYPQVGGYWIVAFQTTGKADLTIETADDTYFGEDLEHVSLKCGDQTLNPLYNGVSVFMQDFECNTTAYHEVHVLTQGKHTQKFTFGDATAFAYNFAGNLPKTINLHGKLKNSTGGTVNQSVNFTFSLYQEASGGENVWTENQTINVSEGIYTAALGIVTPITVNFSQPYYLGIKVNSDSEMEPRVNLTNQPYAYNTFYAQEALDLSCTDCIGNTEINTSGTFTIDGTIQINETINLKETNTTISQLAGYGKIYAKTPASAIDNYTKLLIHADGAGNSFTDSATGKTITANGDATQSATQSVFGGKSASFDGDEDYLFSSGSNDWAFGAGNFTIDFWLRFNALSAGTYPEFFDIAYNQGGSTGMILRQEVDNQRLNLMVAGTFYDTVLPWNPSINTWYHLAIVRSGDTIQIFVNGGQIGSNITNSAILYGNDLYIGKQNNANFCLNGSIDELRISKGIARWTSNFTPPQSSYGGTGLFYKNSVGTETELGGSGGTSSSSSTSSSDGTGGWTNTSTQTATSLDVNIGSGKFFVNATSGNVGIGTTSPAQQLTVVGNVNITNNITISTGKIYVDSNGDLIFVN